MSALAPSRTGGSAPQHATSWARPSVARHHQAPASRHTLALVLNGRGCRRMATALRPVHATAQSHEGCTEVCHTKACPGAKCGYAGRRLLPRPHSRLLCACCTVCHTASPPIKDQTLQTQAIHLGLSINNGCPLRSLRQCFFCFPALSPPPPAEDMAGPRGAALALVALIALATKGAWGRWQVLAPGRPRQQGLDRGSPRAPRRSRCGDDPEGS